MTLLEILKAGTMRVYEIGNWPQPFFSATILAPDAETARAFCKEQHGFAGPYCVDITREYIEYLIRQGSASANGIKVWASPEAIAALAEKGIFLTTIADWAGEFLARLGVEGKQLTGIYIDDSDPGYCGQYSRTDRVVRLLSVAQQTAVQIKATLLHELVHYAQHVQGKEYRYPDTGDAFGREFLVLYYATSANELMALAWECNIDHNRYELLRDVIAWRLQHNR